MGIGVPSLVPANVAACLKQSPTLGSWKLPLDPKSAARELDLKAKGAGATSKTDLTAFRALTRVLNGGNLVGGMTVRLPTRVQFLACKAPVNEPNPSNLKAADHINKIGVRPLELSKTDSTRRGATSRKGPDPRSSTELKLIGRIEQLRKLIANPAARYPTYGKGDVIHANGKPGPLSNGAFPNKLVALTITKLDNGKITLSYGGGRTDTITMTIAEFHRHLDGGVGKWSKWVVLKKPTELAVKPRLGDTYRRELAVLVVQLAKATLAREIKANPVIGKRLKLYSAVNDRKRELLGQWRQKFAELQAWKKEHGGFKSMGRLVTALVRWDSAIIGDPEYYGNAPQRQELQNIAKRLRVVSKALDNVKAVPPRNILDGISAQQVSEDFALGEIAKLNKTGIVTPGDQMRLRLGTMQEAVKQGRFENALVAYHATIQPFLHLKGEKGDSFHYTANGKTSLTLLVNQMIHRGQLPNGYKLVTTADGLKKLESKITALWTTVRATENRLNRTKEIWPAGGMGPVIDTARFRARFDSEVARLRALETGAPHKKLLKQFGDRGFSVANAGLTKITASKKWDGLKDFGSGVLNILDSPETWAAVGATALTAGTASGVILGRAAAVSIPKLATMVRAGTVSARALGYFAASTSIDAVVVHSLVNTFSTIVGNPNRADWSPSGYLRSIVLFNVLGGVGARHIGKMNPAKYGRFRTSAALFMKETAAVSLLAVGESYISHGNFSDAASTITSNLQFMIGLRMAFALRRLGPTQERKMKKLVALEEKAQKALDAYQALAARKAPAKEQAAALWEASVAFREYVVRLERLNSPLHKQGLASDSAPLLQATTIVVKPSVFEHFVQRFPQRLAASKLSTKKKAELKQRYDSISKEGAFFDPLSAITYVRAKSKGQVDPFVIRHEWTHQIFHNLKRPTREVVVAAVSGHKNWLAIQEHMIQSHPHMKDHSRSQMVDEVLAHFHGTKKPDAALAALMKPIIELKEVIQSGLSKPPDPSQLITSYRNRSGETEPVGHTKQSGTKKESSQAQPMDPPHTTQVRPTDAQRLRMFNSKSAEKHLVKRGANLNKVRTAAKIELPPGKLSQTQKRDARIDAILHVIRHGEQRIGNMQSQGGDVLLSRWGKELVVRKMNGEFVSHQTIGAKKHKNSQAGITWGKAQHYDGPYMWTYPKGKGPIRPSI